MAGNHEADATTQPCVGVKGIDDDVIWHGKRTFI